MAAVFISYAREDREFAQRLGHALEVDGWSVWWDRDLNPGESFDEVIERELSLAEVVIVVWSETSVKSPWVRSEANAALDRGVLIPVLIDVTTPPLRFRMVEAVDFSTWDGSADHAGFQRLVRGVRALVHTPVPPPLAELLPPPPQPVQPLPAPPSRLDPDGAGAAPSELERSRGRASWWALGAVGVVAALVIVVLLTRGGGDGASSVTSGGGSPGTAGSSPTTVLTTPSPTVTPSSPPAARVVPLTNPSFEGNVGWRAINKPNSVEFGIAEEPSLAHDGETVGFFVAGEPLGSIAQDVDVAVGPGDTLVFSIWVRSAEDASPFDGRVAIWLLVDEPGGEGEEPPRAVALDLFTPFQATNEWRRVEFELTAVDAHSTARVEVYADTTDRGLLVDSAELTHRSADPAR
jgi:hypothetical protein